MQKKEMRETIVIYCDYCGKELTPPYSSIKSEKDMKLDFCSSYKSGEKTCFEKYKEEKAIK